MQKTDIISTSTSFENLPPFISEENKHLFPEDMQFAFDYINSRPIVFPERYLRAQKNHLRRKIYQLYKEKSDLSPKMVLTTLLAPLPDFIPADMVATLCVHIMECWQEESKEVTEKVVQ